MFTLFVPASHDNKNTTLSVGLAYAADTVELVGDAPVPFSNQSAAKGANSESKDTVDVMLGMTQILSKNTLMQVNYSASSCSVKSIILQE